MTGLTRCNLKMTETTAGPQTTERRKMSALAYLNLGKTYGAQEKAEVYDGPLCFGSIVVRFLSPSIRATNGTQSFTAAMRFANHLLQLEKLMESSFVPRVKLLYELLLTLYLVPLVR